MWPEFVHAAQTEFCPGVEILEPGCEPAGFFASDRARATLSPSSFPHFASATGEIGLFASVPRCPVAISVATDPQQGKHMRDARGSL
jgi:hypothetical protein